MATKFETFDEYATKMAETFKKHSSVISVADPTGDNSVANCYVSNQGLSELGDIFDTVPMSYRPGVFSMFLDKLEAVGIKYDIDQFSGNVH